MGKVYVISDRRMLRGGSLPSFARDCARGGAAMFQIREKDLSDRDLLALARRLVRFAGKGRMKILVNGRVDVALAAGAHGVHLGSGTIPVAEARRRMGPRRLIGYSAHGLAEARRAQKAGADFVTFSPIFATREPFKGSPKGAAALKRVAQTLSIPIYALGGISHENAGALRRTGVAGAAVVSAAARAARPKEAVRRLRAALPAPPSRTRKTP